MRFETFVAFRYLRAKRKNRFISLISLISVAGVSVGVITLIVVLGVMTGFNVALRNTIIGNRAHLNIIDPRGYAIEDYRAAIEEIEKVVPEIQASGPFLHVQALLENRGGRKSGRVTSGALLVGVDPELESKVTQLTENLTDKGGRLHGAADCRGRRSLFSDLAWPIRSASESATGWLYSRLRRNHRHSG